MVLKAKTTSKDRIMGYQHRGVINFKWKEREQTEIGANGVMK
jgi:hypothetical protein